MTVEVVIGVDSSTTGTKAVAFDAAGTAVAEGRQAITRRSPQPGWQEQDADDWWASTAAALRQLVSQLGAGCPPCAIAVTHQRETFVCAGERDEQLRPAILWLDTRARQEIAELGDERVHDLSGKPASTTPSLYKLAWLRRHEPGAISSAVTVYDVHGYLVRKLTGRRATSWGAADPLSLVDMRTFTWSPELVELAGLRPEQLPDLVSPGAVIGTVSAQAADQTGLPEGLPVVAGAGDGQCAGLGAGVLQPGRAYLNLGTGLTLGVHSDAYQRARAFRTLSSPLGHGYTLEALLSSGALSIAWMRDHVLNLAPGGEGHMEELASHVPAGSRGLLFLPYLTSAETPWWDADARGAFVGLDDGTEPGQLYRAVLEGLALEQRLSIDAMEEATGTRVDDVVVLGGASRSRLFTQVLADVLERPLRISREVETTALGAAMLAAAAVGLSGIGDLADAARRMTGTSRSVAPDPRTAALYKRSREAYRLLYPSLRSVFPLLAEVRAAQS